MANHKVVAMWNERPLGTEAEGEAIRQFQEEVAARKAEIRSIAEQARKATPKEQAAKLAEELKRKRASLAEFEKNAPAVPVVMGVEDRQPTHLRVHIRGSHLTLGEEVPRRFPAVLARTDGTVVDRVQERPPRARRTG